MELIQEVKTRVRLKTAAFDEAEVNPLISACKKDLERVGVAPDENNPLVRQAIVLFCKAHFGFSSDGERFRLAYEGLRDSMSLSGDFTL